MVRLILAIGWGRGIRAHKSMAKVKAIKGAIRNRAGEEVEGRIGSFINNFTPSAIGWRRP